jgi:hypothetical protein
MGSGFFLESLLLVGQPSQAQRHLVTIHTLYDNSNHEKILQSQRANQVW